MGHGAGRAHAAARRNLQVAGVDGCRVMWDLRAGVDGRGAEHVRAWVERQNCAPQRHVAQCPQHVGGVQRRKLVVGDAFGQADVEVEAERRSDLVLEELAEGAMLGVDSAQQLAFIEAEGDDMVGLALTRLPGRFLLRHDLGQPVQVSDNAAVNRRGEGVQAALVREEMAHGHLLLALLGELGPVGGDAVVVVEPAARVRHGERHGGHALGSRIDQGHGVLFPGGVRRLVAYAAPQVDHLFAAAVDAAGAAELIAKGEVLDKRIPHGLKAFAREPVDLGRRRSLFGHDIASLRR